MKVKRQKVWDVEFGGQEILKYLWEFKWSCPINCSFVSSLKVWDIEFVDGLIILLVLSYKTNYI